MLAAADRARLAQGLKGVAIVLVEANRGKFAYVLAGSAAREEQLGALLRADAEPVGLVSWFESGPPVAMPFDPANLWGRSVLEFFISRIEHLGLVEPRPAPPVAER